MAGQKRRAKFQVRVRGFHSVETVFFSDQFGVFEKSKNARGSAWRNREPGCAGAESLSMTDRRKKTDRRVDPARIEYRTLVIREAVVITHASFHVERFCAKLVEFLFEVIFQIARAGALVLHSRNGWMWIRSLEQLEVQADP